MPDVLLVLLQLIVIAFPVLQDSTFKVMYAWTSVVQVTSLCQIKTYALNHVLQVTMLIQLTQHVVDVCLVVWCVRVDRFVRLGRIKLLRRRICSRIRCSFGYCSLSFWSWLLSSLFTRLSRISWRIIIREMLRFRSPCNKVQLGRVQARRGIQSRT